MIRRVLALALLLSWQAAVLSCPQFLQPVVGAAASILVGLALIVLLVGALEDEPEEDEASQARALEHLAFHIQAH